MNKTVTVNIGGIVFHIDENAYERFKQYLESIRKHFTASEGRDEIMQDIESRIAEMFQERIRDSKQVITITDVDEVSALMGKPEEFGDENKEEAEQASGAEGISTTPVKKKLFRNPDDKLVGGVCSGISAYFDIDPVWIRLIFAFSLIAWGSGFLLYILLWIIIPKAETTAEKLQMRGEAITVDNIGKNVQEELDQVKKRLNEISLGKKPGNFVSRFFDGLGQLFRLLFLFIGKLIAVFFLFLGLVMVFVMFATLLAIFKVPGAHYPEILNQIFPYGFQFGLALFGAMLVVGIPFIMLAYFGARVLFNVKRSSRPVKMGAIGLWFAGLLICVILGASIAKDFSEKQSIYKDVSIQQPAEKKFYVTMDKKHNNEKDYENWDENEWNGDLRLSLKEDQLQSRDIRLDIVESPNDSFQLVEICYARGDSRKAAADHASRISYSLSQSDTVLSFSPYFVINKDEKYRAQKVQLILKVPKGGKVYLDKSLRGFIYDVDNVQNVFDRDMLNRTWEMRDDGLNCVDCDGTESTIGGQDFVIPPSPPGHPHIRIDDNGLYIQGDNDEVLAIDSNGIMINKNGKKKMIRKGNVKVTVDDKEWQ